jgi:energy-coupling factor transport system substrate-specific component
MQLSLLDKLTASISPILLVLLSAVGLVTFCWPLILSASSPISFNLAPALTAFVLVVSLVAVFTSISAGQLHSKAIALLGLLSALIAAARLLGAHAFGIEPMWAFIVIAGRALGPTIGFSAGSLGMASSAVITGGIGPWLPFQMLAAGWVGLIAGLVPLPKTKLEIPALAVLGAILGIFVGLLLNLWFWPTATIGNESLSYVAGASITENLTKLILFTLATSASFDIPRAGITFLIIMLIGGGMLKTIRRITRPNIFVLQESIS